MKFDEFFSEVQVFTGGITLVSGYLDKNIALKMIESSIGHTIENHKIRSDYVRFGFAPYGVDDREDFEGKPIWYTGASGKGSKPVWVYRGD